MQQAPLRILRIRSNKNKKQLRTSPHNNLRQRCQGENVNFFRHFVPASQEWYNSIYTYNKNYPKTIPVADISLMKLFKGYFNYGIRLTPVNRLPLGSSPSFLAPHATHAPDAFIKSGRGKEALAAQQLGSNAAQQLRSPGKGPIGPFEGKKTFGAFEASSKSITFTE
ncbi:hypothetical protein OnM2_021016 [Erysiphe neolycopersici]|uniref:Uncharacterized protein n=1 Tax=Erysiphe neolycopersici TaxID=212602 RepID=A0A420I2T0_9PEZI|nr:hypothetical protein OnM2_021016 [Erysiphe neolycopersici]